MVIYDNTVFISDYKRSSEYYPEYCHIEGGDKNLAFLNMGEKKHRIRFYGVDTDRRNGKVKGYKLLFKSTIINNNTKYLIDDMSMFNNYQRIDYTCDNHKNEIGHLIIWKDKKPHWNKFRHEIRKIFEFHKP